MSFIINKIKPQKKHKNRFSLYSNDEFIIGVSDSTLLQYGLQVGAEITDELLVKINENEDRDAIQNSALRYLARRQHSVKELKDKLRKKNNNSQLINQVIQYLLKKNYLNDNDFAATFLREEIKLKKSGSLLIKKKLLQKGVNIEIIDSLLTSDYLPEFQLKNCKYLAHKKLSILKKQSSAKQKKLKLVNYLKQKGYTWDICEQIINSLNPEENDEENT